MLFRERGETKLDLVRYYDAVADAADAHDGRPPGAHAALPARRRRAVVLPEARARERARVARDHDREHRQRHDVAGAGRRRRRARRVGGQPRRASASTCGRTAPTTPSTPTSCASTSTRSRAPTSTDVRRAAAREVKALLDELGIVGYPKTTGNRGLHVYVRLRAALGLVRGALRRRGGGPRARAPAPRPHHRGLVEGGARASGSSSTSTRTRRTRPCSARGRCGPAPGAQVSTPLRWDELDDVHPDELTIATRARRAWSATATRGRRSTTTRSRSSRCSRCTSATAPTACWTRRGRRCTRSSRTSRRASRPAARSKSE